MTRTLRTVLVRTEKRRHKENQNLFINYSSDHDENTRRNKDSIGYFDKFFNRNGKKGIGD
jgi:hypothetical protein